MSIIKQFWAWLTGLFNKTEKPQIVNAPASVATLPESAQNQTVPKSGKIVPDTGTLADAETIERRKDIDFTAQAIAKHAEHYEMHQQDLYVDWSQDPDLFVEACFHVNWPAVVRQYSDKTMRRVLGSGTNFNFKGHESLRQLISAAIRAEAAWRAPDAPGSHGMAQDGGQR